MNLALTDPFILAQDYPEALTGKLSTIVFIVLIKCLLTTYVKDLAMQRASDSTGEEIFLLQAAYATMISPSARD